MSTYYEYQDVGVMMAHVQEMQIRLITGLLVL